MATHASVAPRKGFPGSWVTLLAALAVVAIVGVAFAAGRGSVRTHTPATMAAQANPGSQLAGMMPWMQTHMGDVTWMRNHGDQWQRMRGHAGDIRWMQTHTAQWPWMQTHMGDIGWMQLVRPASPRRSDQ